MADFNRRDWLKSSGLIGAATLLSGWSTPEVLTQEIKSPKKKNSLVRLNSNENPYGPSEKVRKAMINAFDDACRYPYSYQNELLELLAKKEGVSKDHIIITGGSTEGLNITGAAFGLYGGEIIAARPTFLSMMDYAVLYGATVNWVDVDKNKGLDLDEMKKRISAQTRLIFLCNPNNPTSTLLPANDLRAFCHDVSERVTVFSDEAYYDFIEDKNYPSMIEFVKEGKNVIVSRTFSKVYGLAGLRIGYLIARPDIITKLNDHVAAFTNVLAIKAAIEALGDNEFYNHAVSKNREGRQMIYKTLDELGLEYVKSNTNFVFFKSGRHINELHKSFMERGVQIGRPFPPFYDWCRISTGTTEEVAFFCEQLKAVLG